MAATNSDATKGILMLFHIEYSQQLCIGITKIVESMRRQGGIDVAEAILRDALEGDPKDWK